VVVDGGRIVEDGSLDDLLMAQGPLRALWDLQVERGVRAAKDGIPHIPAPA
jgi:hypothetical protein